LDLRPVDRNASSQEDVSVVTATSVINATGPAADRLCRHPISFALLRSQYWEFLTAGAPLPASQPVVVLPDAYLKPSPQGTKIEVGLYEVPSEQVVYASCDDVPDESLDASMRTMEAKYSMLQTQLPDIDSYELRSYTAGMTSYTPDGLPVVVADDNNINGAQPGSGGGRVVTFAGCNGYGVTWSGGIGSLLSDLAVRRSPCDEHPNPPAVPEEFDWKRFSGMDRAQMEEACIRRRVLKHQLVN
jgi:4-methylaminobutanoate oxidase (formaldehyde-forming)